MGNLALIVVLLAAGRLCAMLSVFPRDTHKALGQFVIHVSLPALILVQVPRLGLDHQVLAVALMPWVLLAASAVAVLGVGRALRWSDETIGAMLLLVPLGNTSFLGIPMIELFLGESCVPYAIVYDQIGTFLALATYGAFVTARYGREELARVGVGGAAGGSGNSQGVPGRPTKVETRGWRAILKKVCTFPPFITLMVAFSLRGVEFPPEALSVLQRIADTLVPVVMVAVGFQFRPLMPRNEIAAASVGLGLKMVAAPLLALVIALAMGDRSDAMRTAVLEAGMPPMITAGVVAISAGLRPRLVSGMIGFGILISPITLWALSVLLPR